MPRVTAPTEPGIEKINVFEFTPASARDAIALVPISSVKERYLKILEFRHFVEFFSFNKIGENHKEKLLVQRVTVVVALDLGTGNTKNPEYESE